MRYRLILAVVLMGTLVLALEPSSTYAQKGGKKGGPGGFGGTPGGFGGGAGGGFQQLPQAGDWKKMADQFRGGAFGAGGGFQQQLQSGDLEKLKMMAEQFRNGGFQRTSGQMQGGFGGFGAANSIDYIKQQAANEFNFYDRNGDGALNLDEMPLQLRAQISRYDLNRDNLITLEEFEFYYGDKTMNRGQGGFNQQFNMPINVFIEEEEDSRPVVYRGGKLPAYGLPSWFKDLADKNGQVPLYAWYKDKGNIEEFSDWDRNNDGFITVQEALARQTILMQSAEEDEDSFGWGGGPKKGKGGKGKGPKGDNGFAGRGPKGDGSGFKFAKGDFDPAAFAEYMQKAGKGGGKKGGAGGGFPQQLQPGDLEKLKKMAEQFRNGGFGAGGGGFPQQLQPGDLERMKKMAEQFRQSQGQ